PGWGNKTRYAPPEERNATGALDRSFVAALVLVQQRQQRCQFHIQRPDSKTTNRKTTPGTANLCPRDSRPDRSSHGNITHAAHLLPSSSPSNIDSPATSTFIPHESSVFV